MALTSMQEAVDEIQRGYSIYYKKKDQPKSLLRSVLERETIITAQRAIRKLQNLVAEERERQVRNIYYGIGTPVAPPRSAASPPPLPPKVSQPVAPPRKDLQPKDSLPVAPPRKDLQPKDSLPVAPPRPADLLEHFPVKRRRQSIRDL